MIKRNVGEVFVFQAPETSPTSAKVKVCEANGEKYLEFLHFPEDGVNPSLIFTDLCKLKEWVESK